MRQLAGNAGEFIETFSFISANLSHSLDKTQNVSLSPLCFRTRVITPDFHLAS